MDVTIEVADPTVAVISTDPTAVGGASITFPLVTGTYTPLIYIQGLSVGQGTELRITAPGYDQWITTIQTVASGFFISLPSGDFTTTVGASNRTVRVCPASLDVLQRVDETQQLIGGLSASVEVDLVRPDRGRDHGQPAGVHRRRHLPRHRVHAAGRGHDDPRHHPTRRVHRTGSPNVCGGHARTRIGPDPPPRDRHPHGTASAAARIGSTFGPTTAIALLEHVSEGAADMLLARCRVEHL